VKSQFVTSREIQDDNLKSQFVTSSWGGKRKMPYAFVILLLIMLLCLRKLMLLNLSNWNIKRMQMLETLLGNLDARSKCERLEKQYGFTINDDTARRVNTMCNLSDVVEERGIEKGIARGIEQGIIRGEEQTVERTVRRLLMKNYPDGEIIDITECTLELLERVKAEMK